MIANSHLTHTGPKAETEVAPSPAAAPSEAAPDMGKRTILFATPTCPNCRIASQYLDKAGVSYEKLMAAENADLCKQYGVKQAPTLIVTDGASFEKIAGAGAIKQYLSERA